MKPPIPAFRNPDLPVAERIDDLLRNLGWKDKAGLLLHEAPGVAGLGIPAYNWWNEACHGVGRSGRATIFPQVIGLGATWNPTLVGAVANAISDEARAKHHAAVALGRHGQYQGLTFWTPNINIFRDPRWGRGQETFGEDPFLTAELGIAMVKGLQGADPSRLKTAACAKHFAVHSGPESERHSFDARPSPKDLAETYLPAFERLVRAGVEAVMGAYNRLNGEPCCASRFLLVDTLRGKWGFQGHVVSDCGAVDDFHLHHGVTADAAESAALALRMGCDLNCGQTYRALPAAFERGLISESELDRALRRLLATQIKLGLFDPPPRALPESYSVDRIDGPAHRALARRAAVESIVLLKNNGILPLPRNGESVLVVGPTAANVDAVIGNYHGVSSRIITIVEGIAEAADEGTRVVYRAGCALLQPATPGINYTFSTAEESETVIAVLGLDATLEGEEGDAVRSKSGGDRDSIELPEAQLVFLRELRRHAKRLILILTGGGAIAIPEPHELCDAVLLVWYPGCEGGRAVADVLFGSAVPSGKMPLTVPSRTGDLPPFNNYAMRGRTYRFSPLEPLYPFGFGLSYTSFGFESIALSRPTLALGESLTVTALVRNTGSRTAPETVQCYVIPPQDWPDAPRSSLVAFEKVEIAPGDRATVKFVLRDEALRQVDGRGERVRLPGNYRVVVGSASPGLRAQTLGAPAPLVADFTLVPDAPRAGVGQVPPSNHVPST